MKSIGKRLVRNFMFVIVITVFILEVLLIYTVRQNYYNNLEDNLYNQLKVSCDLYQRYFSDTTLHENVINNVDTFWKQSTAQVEIIDTSGRVVMDSIGVLPGDVSGMPDVKQALGGVKGSWKGKVNYDDEEVMAISSPLSDGKNIVGVLRFISSLREINDDIVSTTHFFVIIGLIAIFISGILSFLLANTIVGPLKEVTLVAKKMAMGNFNVQSRKRHEDEVGKLSDTLNYMAQEIVKNDQIKNEFISSISHELRTPLTSIKGWAVTLKDGCLRDEEMLKDGLDIIEKESDRLTLMVEELLDFSKFVSGKITMKNEKVNIIQIMEHIRKQMAPRANRDNIEFKVSYDRNIPVIFSDDNRLKQLFINILDNAFKFTQPGGRVSFDAQMDGKRLVFSVKDTGCGIPEDELPRVKEKFFKGKTSKSKNGIGLSICDEIVKIMGGSLDIRSEIKKGTEVYITLPLQEGDKIE